MTSERSPRRQWTKEGYVNCTACLRRLISSTLSLLALDKSPVAFTFTMHTRLGG